MLYIGFVQIKKPTRKVSFLDSVVGRTKNGIIFCGKLIIAPLFTDVKL